MVRWLLGANGGPDKLAIKKTLERAFVTFQQLETIVTEIEAIYVE